MQGRKAAHELQFMRRAPATFDAFIGFFNSVVENQKVTHQRGASFRGARRDTQYALCSLDVSLTDQNIRLISV